MLGKYAKLVRFTLPKNLMDQPDLDVEGLVRGEMASRLKTELEKAIHLSDVSNLFSQDSTLEATVVIIPTNEAAEINKKLKRLAELEEN